MIKNDKDSMKYFGDVALARKTTNSQVLEWSRIVGSAKATSQNLPSLSQSEGTLASIVSMLRGLNTFLQAAKPTETAKVRFMTAQPTVVDIMKAARDKLICASALVISDLVANNGVQANPAVLQQLAGADGQAINAEVPPTKTPFGAVPTALKI